MQVSSKDNDDSADMNPRTTTDIRILFALAVLTMIGIVYSKILPSICMWILVLVSQVSVNTTNEGKYTYRLIGGSRQIWHSIWKSQKNLFWLSLLFFITLVTIFSSSNLSYWLKIGILKVPFLVIPLALAFYQNFSFRDRRNVVIMAASILAISTIPVLIDYGVHYEEYTRLLSRGIAIPTPLNHIKYSLLIGLMACFLLVMLFNDRYQVDRVNKLRWVIIGLCIFLFIVNHVLAVRTGLIAMYIGLLTTIAFSLVKAQKYRKYALLLMIVISGTAIIAIKTIPSIQKKIGYTIYDLTKYQNSKDASNFSIAGRMYSYKAGLNIWKTAPLFGVGVGDVKDEMKHQYQKVLNIKNGPNLPHNQFLLTAVGTGLVGLVLFLIGIFAPFLGIQYRNDPMVWVFLLMLSSAFMVDNIIERSASIAYFVYLHCLLVKTDYEDRTMNST